MGQVKFSIRVEDSAPRRAPPPPLSSPAPRRRPFSPSLLSACPAIPRSPTAPAPHGKAKPRPRESEIPPPPPPPRRRPTLTTTRRAPPQCSSSHPSPPAPLPRHPLPPCVASAGTPRTRHPLLRRGTRSPPLCRRCPSRGSARLAPPPPPQAAVPRTRHPLSCGTGPPPLRRQGPSAAGACRADARSQRRSRHRRQSAQAHQGAVPHPILC